MEIMMRNELTELLDAAIYKEIASQAFYIAGQSKTQDPSAKALMKELAEEEFKHSQLLKNFKEGGLKNQEWHQQKLPTRPLRNWPSWPYTRNNPPQRQCGGTMIMNKHLFSTGYGLLRFRAATLSEKQLSRGVAILPAQQS